MAPEDVMPEALATLRATPRVLHDLLDALPDGATERRNPEGWTIKDVVAHLHDAEDIAFTTRIGRMLAEDQPFIESIDPPARLLQGGYAVRTLVDLLDSLERVRAAHLDWLLSLSADQLGRSGRHDTAGMITVSDVVHQWAYHDLAHLRQIMEMLQAELVPHMGSTRSFYPETQGLLDWR